MYLTLRNLVAVGVSTRKFLYLMRSKARAVPSSDDDTKACPLQAEDSMRY